jgi:NADPH:quinone reductase-like Zn-dependent oxidoreductase
MKVITQDRYGGPGVLELREAPQPAVGEREVLIRVHAAGLDAGVWHLMEGLPLLVRLGYGLRRPRTAVRGREVSGRVEAAGSAVTRFRPGDEVYGFCKGAFAEYATAREDQLLTKPAALTHEQAAAVPISGVTALQAVRDRGRVRPGHRVLVVGAGGGVGTYAVQLARAAGAEVTGVCGPAKAELVLSLGAVAVVDYTAEDFTERPERYDVILDLAGNRPLGRVRRALTPRGTLVLVGGENGGRWLGGMERVLGATLLSPFTPHRLLGLVSAERTEDLAHVTGLIESGEVTPVIDGGHPLTAVPELVRRAQEGKSAGKTVITP